MVLFLLLHQLSINYFIHIKYHVPSIEWYEDLIAHATELRISPHRSMKSCIETQDLLWLLTSYSESLDELFQQVISPVDSPQLSGLFLHEIFQWHKKIFLEFGSIIQNHSSTSGEPNLVEYLAYPCQGFINILRVSLLDIIYVERRYICNFEPSGCRVNHRHAYQKALVYMNVYGPIRTK